MTSTNETKRAVILGAGMVGSTMAADLSADSQFDVTIADVRAEALERVRVEEDEAPFDGLHFLW